jgi:hypothetical protein
MTSSRHFRVFLAAFMAVWASLRVTENASAATGRARAAEMFQHGCCCVTEPASGCCCETETPLSLNSAAPMAIDGLPGMTGERVETTRGGRCQCSPGEPVAPRSESRSTNVKRETKTRSLLQDLAFTTPERPSSALRWSASSRGRPPDAPIYLRYSRLVL